MHLRSHRDWAQDGGRRILKWQRCNSSTFQHTTFCKEHTVASEEHEVGVPTKHVSTAIWDRMSESLGCWFTVFDDHDEQEDEGDSKEFEVKTSHLIIAILRWGAK